LLMDIDAPRQIEHPPNRRSDLSHNLKPRHRRSLTPLRRTATQNPHRDRGSFPAFVANRSWSRGGGGREAGSPLKHGRSPPPIPPRIANSSRPRPPEWQSPQPGRSKTSRSSGQSRAG
jgi:hypothetical protein